VKHSQVEPVRFSSLRGLKPETFWTKKSPESINTLRARLREHEFFAVDFKVELF
jgi:hypothetical protein